MMSSELSPSKRRPSSLSLEAEHAEDPGFSKGFLAYDPAELYHL